jgi:hypothetical protein
MLVRIEDDFDPMPSAERRQHDKIKRFDEQIKDVNGLPSAPWRVKGLLAKLESNGAIGKPERLAGQEFQEKFALAQLDPIRAVDMAGIPGLSRPAHHCGNVKAQQQIHEALQALGGISSPAGSCAWFVLGCEHSLRRWAQREGWNGRPLNERVASGILIAVLGVLMAHFDGER